MSAIEDQVIRDLTRGRKRTPRPFVESELSEALHAALQDEWHRVLTARAERMATHENPELQLWVSSMHDAVQALVGANLRDMVLHGEAAMPDYDSDEFREAFVTAFTRNREYLNRARRVAT